MACMFGWRLMKYVIFDYIRAYDIERMDTPAETPEEARRLAEAMARLHHCKVYILEIVGVVECLATEPSWTKPLEYGK